jgi:hypothetical protein
LELSTAITALFAGVSPLVQAEIVPSSVAKMKVAGRFVSGTRNAVAGLVVGFQMIPVGAADVGFGGLFGLTVLQSVAGMTFPGGIDTCSAALVALSRLGILDQVRLYRPTENQTLPNLPTR